MHQNGGPPMKIIMLLALFIAVGCILATGCIAAQPKPTPVNATTAPTNTFTPFVQTTTIPGSIAPLNTTNASNTTNATQKLKGPLRVSISGYPVNLNVTIDDENAGMVTKEKPLDLMLPEGIHNVSVCVGDICEKETVSIVFAKKTFVDFGDRLRKDVEFPEPTARIVQFFKNGNGVTVSVEFINPSPEEVVLNTELSLGYSYIDPRSGTRKGESSRKNIIETMRPNSRYTYDIDLNFVYGDAPLYDSPQMGPITIK